MSARVGVCLGPGSVCPGGCLPGECLCGGVCPGVSARGCLPGGVCPGVSVWGVYLGGVWPGVSAFGMSAREVCLPMGGFLPRGVSVQGEGMSAEGVSAQGGMSDRHPPVKRMTDRCKNITLPQLCCGR